MKKTKKRPMELGVLSILREETNVFDVIAKYGVATTQLANWNMNLWTPQMAKKVKKDLLLIRVHIIV